MRAVVESLLQALQAGTRAAEPALRRAAFDARGRAGWAKADLDLTKQSAVADPPSTRKAEATQVVKVGSVGSPRRDRLSRYVGIKGET